MRFIVGILLTCFAFSIDAQKTAFQRLYKNNDVEISNFSSSSAPGEQTLLLNGIYEKANDPQFFNALHFMRLDKKGDTISSRAIYVEYPGDSLFINRQAAIYASNDKESFISFNLATEEKFNQGIIKLGDGDTIVFAKVFEYGSDLGDIMEAGINLIHPHYVENQLLQMLNIRRDLGRDTLTLNVISEDGQLINSIGFTDAETNIPLFGTGINVALDSSVLLAGNADDKVFALVLQEENNVRFAKKFSDTSVVAEGSTRALLGHLLLFDPLDSSFVLVLQQSIFDTLGNFLQNNPLVVKILGDSTLLWSRIITSDKYTDLRVRDASVDKFGNILLTGYMKESGLDTAYQFFSKINRSGTQVTTRRYDRVGLSEDHPWAKINLTSDEAYSISHTSAKDEKIAPSLIKTDETGATMESCSELVDLKISDKALVVENLTVKITNTSNPRLSDIPVRMEGLIEFDIPVRKLESANFCPNEPIDFTFRATDAKAVSYLWNDGSTADTLRVFADGTYSVMVFFDDDVCFTLCDTGVIEKINLPVVNLLAGVGDFCTTGKYRIFANVQADAGYNISNLLWSTGEQGVISIDITEEEAIAAGSYSVTVTDNCGEVATSTIQSPIFIQLIDSVWITPNFVGLCDRLTGTLTAQANGDIIQAIWSNGFQGDELSIVNPDLYSVTVTDFCGNTAEASFTADYDRSNEKRVESVNVTRNFLCQENALELSAQITGQFINVTWLPSGETTDKILIREEDFTSGSDDLIVRLQVLDDCGIEEVSVPLTRSDVLQSLKFPKVSIGGAQLSYEANGRFAPVKPEGLVVNQYELRIFNRWGQEIFFADSPDIEWNLTYTDGKPVPVDTYVWYAKYTVQGGCDFQVKGDVTVIR